MKLHNIFFVLFVLNAFINYSCTKIASDVTPPEFRQKLIIRSFISPGKTENTIFITSNSKRFGEISVRPEPFGNTSLILYENSREIQLDTVLQKQYSIYAYEGDNFIIRNFQFKEGMTYKLVVSSDIGLKAEATCTIPVKRDFDIRIDTLFIKTKDQYGQNISVLTAKIYITDYPEEANYYRLLYRYRPYIKYSYSKNSQSTNNIIESVIPTSTPDQDLISTDHGNDGKTFVLKRIEFMPVYLDHNITKPDSAFLDIYLLSIDKPYYDFHKSMENYSMGENPFMEATQFYSNVKGGLGIFASYVIDSLNYRIK